MLAAARCLRARTWPSCSRSARRFATAEAATGKKEGDISSVFRSLSGGADEALPQRFADVKRGLLSRGPGKAALQASWARLLQALQEDVEEIQAKKQSIIPEIAFSDLDKPSAEFSEAFRKRGIAVIRQVVPEQEARQYKEDIERYIVANPSTKAFPADDPQVFELYWSLPQIKARAHPNMLRAQRFLLSYYHSREGDAACSTRQPLTYADRLRIRQPGDAGFALGPHIDGGSVERWEDGGYGRGRVYEEIFQGRWEAFDPWELSTRLEAVQDLYAGAGACSMFRMFQGWLGMSHTGPGEGTLLVNPLFGRATAYFLLRPFFVPTQAPSSPGYLEARHWVLEEPVTATLQGAWPGAGQELSTGWHPHLGLEETMVHVPRIAPGDYVAWHGDTIHAVDLVHGGTADSSVLYIPACPTTRTNLDYLARQRASFEAGRPPPDFPGGVGESGHVSRPDVPALRAVADEAALRAFGYAPFEAAGATSAGEQAILAYGNRVLGWE